MRLAELERNDVTGALAYVAEQLDKSRKLKPDDAAILVQLQDDEDEYLARFAKLMEDREAAGLAFVG